MAQTKQERRTFRSDEINRKFTYLCEVVLADLKELALRIYTEDYLNTPQTATEIDRNVTKSAEEAISGLGKGELDFIFHNRTEVDPAFRNTVYELKKHVYDYIDTPAAVVTLKGK